MDTILHRNTRFSSLLLVISLIPVLAFAKPPAISGIQEQSLLPLENTGKDERQQEYSVKNRSNDPIMAFGHGQFFGQDGKVFEPTPENIREAQNYYITKVLANSDITKDRRLMWQMEKNKTLIYESVEDNILANALYLDELLSLSDGKKDTIIQATLDGLRRYYINNYLKQKHELEKGVFSKGIHPEIAKILERDDITVFLKTDASGDKYIEECREAGVPIPPPMYDKPWENRGIFSNEFISTSSFAELWFYESLAPEGACLALPRYATENGKSANLLGLICLGKESSKACFWDNPSGVKFERGKPVSIEKFLGGAALNTNGQGTCTACHAGENPFIVHPDKPPFSGLTSSLLPDNWHQPLVHPNWPENPGPTTILDIVSSDQRCDSCHQQGAAGRFPDVSDPAISQYCSAVLERSVFGGPKQTMPMGGGSIWNYFNHIDALLSACYGDVVDTDPIPDDYSFISPPIIIDPLYACATKLAVSGTLLDAKVSVYINGSYVDSKISRSPSQLDFDVPTLQVGDVVTATQEFNGVLSDPSDPVTVGDHKVDFPAGLPKPKIDPTLIYECGNTIAVRHIPGAELTVYVNGVDPRSRNTSTGWSGIYPGKYPFDLGDEFTVEVSLCTDTSPISDKEVAIAAPDFVNAPSFDLPPTYPGQELVNIKDILHGAWVEVGETSLGGFGKFSTPVSWRNEYDFATPLGAPLSAGDQLYVQQHLCDSGPPSDMPPVNECEELPAPKIRIPLEGEDYVIVTEAVAGARIQVYDAGNNELGDSSGSIIALNRALIYNETISVTQSIAECKSRFAYKVKVRRIERGKGRDKG